MSRGDYRKTLIRGILHGVGLSVGLALSGILAITISGTINTFSPGEVVSADSINTNFASLKAAINGLPDCTENTTILSDTSGQTVADSTYTVLNWNTEEYDALDLHTAGASRVTIQTAGRYLVIAGIAVGNSPSGGDRLIRILKNGGSVITNTVASQNTIISSASPQVSGVLNLTAGDYLEVEFYQNAGSSLTTSTSQNVFSVARLCGD